MKYNNCVYTVLSLLFLIIAFSPVISIAQVASHQKISNLEGNFTGVLDDGDAFGWAVANLGDLDGDGVNDLAIGMPGDDDGGENAGTVWVLFLNSDGTVKSHQKISPLAGGFTGMLEAGDGFGHSLASIGDFDKDGVNDLAVGALFDDDGGPDRGAFWLLLLNADGTVKANLKVSDTEGNFSGILNDSDGFGHGIVGLGDLDMDGVDDLAAATGHITHEGVIWVLFMNADGTVRDFQRIAEGVGGFTGELDPEDELGHDMDIIGDFDGDGVVDIVAGVPHDDDGGSNRGAFYILYLNADGTVKAQQKISDTEGGFTGVLDDGDVFGHPPSNAGDLDGDGVIDLYVGAPFDDDGGVDVGAVWILYLNGDGTVKAHQKVSQTEGGFTGVLGDGGLFAHLVVSMGDINGDGLSDFVVGHPHDDDGGPDRGAAWILFSDGSTPPPPDPLAIISVIPDVLEPGTTAQVTISGTGFMEGATVFICRPGGVTVTGTTVVDANTIVVDVDVAATASGNCGVRVRNPNGDRVVARSIITIAAQ